MNEESYIRAKVLREQIHKLKENKARLNRLEGDAILRVDIGASTVGIDGIDDNVKECIRALVEQGINSKLDKLQKEFDSL